jgi:S1 RNA binding domain protein
MPKTIGSEIEGKITGITNYGAFVDLGEGDVGLVHISQVSDQYVTDINQFLKVGDLVKVKVLGMVKEGKYDLSMKQVGREFKEKPRRRAEESPPTGSFEHKITQFLKESEERLLDWKRNLEGKQGGKKKRK